MSGKSWAAIATPAVVEASAPQSADDGKKSTFVVIPRAKRFDTSRSIGQTKLAHVRPSPQPQNAPKPSSTKFVSVTFPVGWYVKVIASLKGSDDSEASGDMRGMAEPVWHNLFNHARRNLFGEAFGTPEEAYWAGTEGLEKLTAAESALADLNFRDSGIARTSLTAHSTGKPCCYC